MLFKTLPASYVLARIGPACVPLAQGVSVDIQPASLKFVRKPEDTFGILIALWTESLLL